MFLGDVVRTGIVDDDVEAIWMLLFEEFTELLDALGLAYVQRAKLDGRIAAILGQDLGLLELWVVLQGLDGFSTSFGRPSSQVDQE